MSMSRISFGSSNSHLRLLLSREFGSSPVRDDFLTKNLIKLCISSAVKKIFGEVGSF